MKPIPSKPLALLAVINAIALSGTLEAGALPNVPGATTTVYATVDMTNMTQAAIAPDGTIYIGYDPDGGSTATRIRKIAPGGTPVTDFGDRAIHDPDALIVDRDGTFSGDAGSLLVGSGWEGLLKISTNGVITTLVAADYGTFGNPDQFVVDDQGRLLWPGYYDGWTDSHYAVVTLLGGTVVKVCDIPYFTQVWLDGLGRMLIYGYGPPRLYSADCAELNWPYGNYGNLLPRLLGRGDFWRDNMYGVDEIGRLLEVDPNGNATVMGTGFTGCGLLFIGDDGSLYLNEPATSHILKIKPELASLSIQVSAVDLCWPTRSGKFYQVQCRSSMTTNQWINLGDPVAGNDGIRCASESTRGCPQQFYRVIELP